MYVVMNKERVQELREERGLSKQALAGVAGISVTTARKLEREEPVFFSTGRKVTEALGVGPSPSLGRVRRRQVRNPLNLPSVRSSGFVGVVGT